MAVRETVAQWWADEENRDKVRRAGAEVERQALKLARDLRLVKVDRRSGRLRVRKGRAALAAARPRSTARRALRAFGRAALAGATGRRRGPAA